MVRFRYTIRSMLFACTIIGSFLGGFLGGWRMRDRLVSSLKVKLIAAEAQREAALQSKRASEARCSVIEQRLAFAEIQSKVELDLERSKTQEFKRRLKAAEALNGAVKRHKPNSDTGQ